MSDGFHLIAKTITTPFLAEAHALTGGMTVTIVIDGVHMQIGCRKFEVLKVEEVNFMDERRAMLAAQKNATEAPE